MHYSSQPSNDGTIIYSTTLTTSPTFLLALISAPPFFRIQPVFSFFLHFFLIYFMPLLEVNFRVSVSTCLPVVLVHGRNGIYDSKKALFPAFRSLVYS